MFSSGVLLQLLQRQVRLPRVRLVKAICRDKSSRPACRLCLRLQLVLQLPRAHWHMTVA
jgi:hypothetical protein